MAEFKFSNQTEVKMYNHQGQTYYGDEKSPDYGFERSLPQIIFFLQWKASIYPFLDIPYVDIFIRVLIYSLVNLTYVFILS